MLASSHAAEVRSSVTEPSPASEKSTGKSAAKNRPHPLNPTFAVALVAALGCLLLALANLNQERVVGWILEDPERTATRMRMLLALLAGIAVLPVAVLSYFSGRMSMEVTRTGRYPPPSVALGRKIGLRKGAEAHAAARTLRFVSIVLGAIALGIPVLFWWLAVTLTPQ